METLNGGVPGPGTIGQIVSRDQEPLHLGLGPLTNFLYGPGTTGLDLDETRDHMIEFERDQGPNGKILAWFSDHRNHTPHFESH